MREISEHRFATPGDQFTRYVHAAVDGRNVKKGEAVTITFPDASDVIAANRLRRESLLYPMDALILAAAEAADATLVTFDSELIENGAVSPSEVLG